jgi:hypothetical protein
VTIIYQPRATLAVKVVAVSPEAEERLAREVTQAERERNKGYNDYISACRERVAQEQAARRAALLRAYQEQVVAWQAAQLRAYQEQLLAYQARRAERSAVSDSDRRTLMILGAFAAHLLKLNAEDEGSAVWREISGEMRDRLIASLIQQEFPEFGPEKTLVVARVIALLIDGS